MLNIINNNKVFLYKILHYNNKLKFKGARQIGGGVQNPPPSPCGHELLLLLLFGLKINGEPVYNPDDMSVYKPAYDSNGAIYILSNSEGCKTTTLVEVINFLVKKYYDPVTDADRYIGDFYIYIITKCDGAVFEIKNCSFNLGNSDSPKLVNALQYKIYYNATEIEKTDIEACEEASELLSLHEAYCVLYDMYDNKDFNFFFFTCYSKLSHKYENHEYPTYRCSILPDQNQINIEIKYYDYVKWQWIKDTITYRLSKPHTPIQTVTSFCTRLCGTAENWVHDVTAELSNIDFIGCAANISSEILCLCANIVTRVISDTFSAMHDLFETAQRYRVKPDNQSHVQQRVQSISRQPQSSEKLDQPNTELDAYHRAITNFYISATNTDAQVMQLKFDAIYKFFCQKVVTPNAIQYYFVERIWDHLVTKKKSSFVRPWYFLKFNLEDFDNTWGCNCIDLVNLFRIKIKKYPAYNFKDKIKDDTVKINHEINFDFNPSRGRYNDFSKLLYGYNFGSYQIWYAYFSIRSLCSLWDKTNKNYFISDYKELRPGMLLLSTCSDDRQHAAIVSPEYDGRTNYNILHSYFNGDILQADPVTGLLEPGVIEEDLLKVLIQWQTYYKKEGYYYYFNLAIPLEDWYKPDDINVKDLLTEDNITKFKEIPLIEKQYYRILEQNTAKALTNAVRGVPTPSHDSQAETAINEAILQFSRNITYLSDNDENQGSLTQIQVGDQKFKPNIIEFYEECKHGKNSKTDLRIKIVELLF